MILSNLIKQEIKAHALEGKTKECCGFILFTDNGNIVYKCRNLANSDIYFDIHPKDYLRAQEIGEIRAIYHSHTTNDGFSPMDYQTAQIHDLPIILFNIPSEEFSIHNPRNYVYPYTGREFKFGQSDCFTLLIDYFKQELGITIPNYYTERHHFIIENNKSILDKENLQKYCDFNGFKIIDDVSDIRKHDILVMDAFPSKVPSHFAICCNEGYILHQPRSSFSKIEKIDHIISNRILFLIRYEQFS